MISETERDVQVRPHKNGLMTVKRGGNAPFAALNEHVTERTTLEIEGEYWKSDVLPVGLKKTDIKGHQKAVEMGDKLLFLMSERTGRSEEDIFREWQREYFMGGNVVGPAVARYVGRDAMKNLVTIPAQDADQIIT